jgi:hypothetical protein
VSRFSVDATASHDAGALVPALRQSRRPAHVPDRSDSSREPPTVHVTIGRLEIRAPQAAPVAAARSESAGRDRHIEDYLKQRASKASR